jgi:hypothetical protein
MTQPTSQDLSSVSGRLAERLDEAAIPYAIGGAYALAAHGVVRMTTDLDVSVYVAEDRLDALFDALERAGCLFERGRARADVALSNLFSTRCGHVFVDVFVSFHSHHAAAKDRRVAIAGADGRPRWFLSIEDLVIHKLAMHRGKDLLDLERVFAAFGSRLDLAYIDRWVAAIAPDPGDRRRATLADLRRRFVGP